MNSPSNYLKLWIRRVNGFIVSNKHTSPSFLIVGCLTALLYFVLFTLLWRMLHLRYEVAVTVSYTLAVSFHFIANRRITFKSHDQWMLHQLPRYAAMVILNYLITILIVELLVKFLMLSPYLGVLCAVGVTVISGYLISKHWVFRKEVKWVSTSRK
ncbi:MAG: GtrA family protein [Nitrososphaera sp.]